MNPEVCAIAAVALNGVIGRENDLPWRLRSDLRYFQKVTTGHAIILGRRNFESIGKALPNRLNIVLTRNKNFSAKGIHVVHSLEEAIALANKKTPKSDGPNKIFIVGGAEVYREAFDKDLIKKLYLTKVFSRPEGDVFFPLFDATRWNLVSRRGPFTETQSLIHYEYQVWERSS